MEKRENSLILETMLPTDFLSSGLIIAGLEGLVKSLTILPPLLPVILIPSTFRHC